MVPLAWVASKRRVATGVALMFALLGNFLVNVEAALPKTVRIPTFFVVSMLSFCILMKGNTMHGIIHEVVLSG